MNLKSIVFLIVKTIILIFLFVLLVITIQNLYLWLADLFGPGYGKGPIFLGSFIVVPGFIILISGLGALLYLLGPDIKNCWVVIFKRQQEYVKILPLNTLFLQRNKYMIFIILGILGLIGTIVFAYFIYLSFSLGLDIIFSIISSILGGHLEELPQLFINLLKIFGSGFLGIWVLYLTILYYNKL